jgi:outer membrane protein insertion porin family
MVVCEKPGIRCDVLLLGLLFVFFAAAGYSSAQTPEPKADDLTVGSMEVKGNVTISATKILSTVRARAGERFDSTSAAEDARRIARIEGVEYAYYNTTVADGQVKLTFVVVEKNLVRAIVFIGNAGLGDKKLLKELSFKQGDYLDTMLVSSGERSIRELYLKKGYPNVAVEADKEKLAVGRVVYNITEGVRTTIKDVTFEGNKSFASGELLRAIKTKPKKYLFWPVYYNTEQVGEDKVSLVEVYQKRGYLDSRIETSVELSEDMKDAHVKFSIEEGPVYLVDEIVFSGNEFLDNAQLKEGLKLEVGGFYSKDRAEYDEKHVRGRFLEAGFVDAATVVEHQFVDGSKVKVEFVISEGERFKVGRIDITGNEEVHDRVIRRILDEEGFRPGEWFNANLARGDGSGELEKLLKRNVFTESAFIEAKGEMTGRRDAQVSVIEGKTGSVMVGAGIASDSGLIGQFVYDQRNFDITDVPDSWTELIMGKAFKGAGQRFRVSLNPGTVVSTFSISFVEPYLYDKPISLETLVSGYQRQRESYDEKRLKGYVGFEKRYRDDWRRGFAVRLEDVEVSDLDGDAPQEIRDVKGHTHLAGGRIYVRRDTTDIRFAPSKGYNFDAGYEQVGGDYTFGILDGTQRWYKTLHEDLAERKTVLEMKVHGATIVGDAPPFEKFYAGGSGSIRGFEYRGVSTRGLQTNVANPERKDPIGSDWILTGNAEVAVPLASEMFSALFFVDGGMIDSGGPRVSVGTGLQILLPQWFGPVPMRFELAAPILDEDEDEARVFNFSVGALF